MKIGETISGNYKVWLEYEGKPLIGRGRYELLLAINESNSLKKSAEVCGISLKTAQNHIKKIEDRIGSKIVTTKKGGVNAGGATELNALGKNLLKKYEEIEKKVLIKK